MKCDRDMFLTWHFSPRVYTYFLSAVCTSCAWSVWHSPPVNHGELWWLQSSLLLKWLQPVHIICVLCLSSANVTFMRLSGLVAEAEPTVWCRREQSEGLAQISTNTQGHFIINSSEKKQSVESLQVCLLRTPEPEDDEDLLQKTTATIKAIINPTVRKSLSPFWEIIIMFSFCIYLHFDTIYCVVR